MPDRTCSLDDCDTKSYARGLCSKHYQRWKKANGYPKGQRKPRPSCSVEGCDRPHNSRGLCHMHWLRQHRHGDPAQVAVIVGDDAARWWSYVNQSGPVPTHCPDLGPCWVWTGATNTEGYASLRVRGRLVRAHRFGYEMLAGPIPRGLVLDHLCINPPCVNPAHLEPVTRAENNARARFWLALVAPEPAWTPAEPS